MAKRPISLRIDETLVDRAREKVGPRGFTELIEELLAGFLGDDTPPVDLPEPDHEHSWRKHVGASGLVVKVCDCGAVA